MADFRHRFTLAASYFLSARRISSHELDRLLARDGNIGTKIDKIINIRFRLRFTLKLSSSFNCLMRIIDHS